MTNSIGIIETKSVAAAAEMLNRILSSYKVELLKTEFPGNGFITLFLTGEYSQMKASVTEAGIVSSDFASYFKSSIITKPDEKLFDLLGSIEQKRIMQIKDQQPEEEKQNIIIVENVVKKTESHQEFEKPVVISETVEAVKQINSFAKRIRIEKTEKEKPEKKQIELIRKSVIDPAKIRADNPTIAKLRMEALGKIDKEKRVSKQVISIENENANGLVSMEQLQQLNVHKLRRYARNFDNFPIKGREISRANREELLNHFKELM